jgi:hypothetical protein
MPAGNLAGIVRQTDAGFLKKMVGQTPAILFRRLALSVWHVWGGRMRKAAFATFASLGLVAVANASWQS